MTKKQKEERKELEKLIEYIMIGYNLAIKHLLDKN